MNLCIPIVDCASPPSGRLLRAFAPFGLLARRTEDMARRARVLDGLVGPLAERGIHGARGIAQEEHAAAKARRRVAAGQHAPAGSHRVGRR